MNRYVLASVLITILATVSAEADTITAFNVSGSGRPSGRPCENGCLFSGTLAVDVTNGTVASAAINFDEDFTFNNVWFSRPTFFGWEIAIRDPFGFSLSLYFDTEPNSESLIGFTGATLTALSGSAELFDVTSGRITPVAPIPEPGTLKLLSLLAGVWMTKRCFQTVP